MADIINAGGIEDIFETPAYAIIFTMIVIAFVILMLLYVAPMYGYHGNPTNLTPTFASVPTP